ncbi:hypothetical protein EY675_09270 [Enterococcus casseliflavus]|nr:hypothetical protein [Enterococcus casseliflavus]
MHVDKLCFSIFIYKMNCLEFTYSLIKANEKKIILTPAEQAEIEWMIASSLHRKLYASRKKSLFYSKIKLSKEDYSLFLRMKKYEYIIDI